MTLKTKVFTHLRNDDCATAFAKKKRVCMSYECEREWCACCVYVSVCVVCLFVCERERRACMCVCVIERDRRVLCLCVGVGDERENMRVCVKGREIKGYVCCVFICVREKGVCVYVRVYVCVSESERGVCVCVFVRD